MAKISIGVIYIIAINIKWQIHDCLADGHRTNYTSLYENIINSNIAYLLKVKNATNNIDIAFKDIVSKNHDKTNVALLFLYKGLNPFIEEVEEGFKHDIYFFQDEIYSFINNGDLFDSDN